MHPLAEYLKDLSEIGSSKAGVAETSYYGPLERLFNDVGKTLKPRVRCIVNLANKGAGIPDGGFFTVDQFGKSKDLEPFVGQLPSRGALEVKGTADDVAKVAAGEQVRKYWERYGQVLVTNLRDLILVGTDSKGQQTNLEKFSLAEDEKVFWALARHYRKTSKELALRFEEFLKRVMLYAAPLAKPEDVAWFLASYARDARLRIESAELPALDNLRSALEQALGIEFVGEKGERFFRSTLIQTLFYGVFAAWVLWNREGDTREAFKWREAGWYLRVPVLQNLFSAIAQPIHIEQADLKEVLNWTADVLNRVDREAFFARFEEEHAVQYFYEPFLSAFDPALRKELGVWYTPSEIVQYMVARVDMVLRTELGIPDGLADPRVYVLDPCCGTGAFLVETIRKIGETLEAKGGDALTMHEVKKAAVERVFGFEIMPAPFVISHLQIGLVLRKLGVPLSAKDKERAGVFLTNSLTGWEAPIQPQPFLREFGLEKEVEAAEEIKRDKPILVVIGNPPYNAYAGISPKEEMGLVDPYKEGLNKPIKEGGWGVRKFNLDDLYVRFFRLAEHRIAEKSGKGVVCYISNFSYLGEKSFVVMRKRFVSEFGCMWFDCLNGDSRKTGKLTPDGRPDPSVFSTVYNRQGIRVGTTIGLLVRRENNETLPVVRFRQFWGIDKRRELLDSLGEYELNEHYEIAAPAPGNRYSFRPAKVAMHYLEWPKVDELCKEQPNNGLMEKRGNALIDISKHKLTERMKKYFDKEITWEEIIALRTGLSKNAAGFNAKNIREKVLKKESFHTGCILKYLIRPFDLRYCYYSSASPLWNRSRPNYFAQNWQGNMFIMSRPKSVSQPEGVPFFFLKTLGDNDSLRGHAYYFPFWLKPRKKNKNDSYTKNLLSSIESTSEYTANLSSPVVNYLEYLWTPKDKEDKESAQLIWLNVLGIGFSEAYLDENAEGIQQDWPRIPFPDNKKALLHSAELGRILADLLNPLESVTGVTTGDIRPELREMGVMDRADGKALQLDSGDLALKCGWGHGGARGEIMPGKGKFNERALTDNERSDLAAGAKKLGLAPEEAERRLGASTLDVFLNEKAYWRNVPVNVWNYHIGGYQVIKKWLSYREEALLGRPLTVEEAREVRDMIRRIAAILLLGPALDENYEKIKSSTYKWPS